jgi:hypothetical protein
MSSLFTEGEIALAKLGLAGLAGPLDVVVGGLGLGYTARAVLEHPGVRSLRVVEALPDVIEWHCRELVPLGKGLRSDPRCELVDGDFFALANSPGFDPAAPGRRFHAILVDIDHSPRHVLAGRVVPGRAAQGLRAVGNARRHVPQPAAKPRRRQYGVRGTNRDRGIEPSFAAEQQYLKVDSAF